MKHMSRQFSESIRSVMLDAIETVIGTSAPLKIQTGAAPASCADADTGTIDPDAARASGQEAVDAVRVGEQLRVAPDGIVRPEGDPDRIGSRASREVRLVGALPVVDVLEPVA